MCMYVCIYGVVLCLKSIGYTVFFDKYLIIVSKIFSQAIETHFLKFNASIIF